MYRVLIVDDEPIAAKSIEYIINNRFTTITVVDMASSGRSAIEKAENLHPDIIIMDINMPGINGLEAMRQIRKENPNVRFIVVSAFDYFDYAVEAVALNVDDYLLKPVKEEKLIESLEKVISQIDARRDKARRDIELKEKFEMISPVLETGFINSICMFDDETEELYNYCRLFDFKCTSGFVIAIQFGDREGGEIKNKIGAGVQGQKLYQYYRGILKSICNCIVGPMMLNRLIVYIPDEHGSGFEQKIAAEEIAQLFYSRAEKLDLDISIGIGRYCKKIENVKESYQQALRALQKIPFSGFDCHILHFDDILENADSDDTEYEKHFIKVFNASTEEQDATAAVAAFQNVFTHLAADKKMDFEELKNKCISIIVGLRSQREDLEKNYSVMLGKIIAVQNQNELCSVCCQCISSAIYEIAAGKQKRINNLIKKANSYMEAHYSDEISLDSIAKEVNLSPYYFSHFYKEETGVNFSDRLMEIRMEKAKEYLIKPDSSIKDVSRQVGYADPNYFSKLFKKITGVTATEYKERYGK